MTNFAGTWSTTFGPMTLEQDGASVTGSYQMGPQKCFIKGQIEGGKLVFEYQEPRARGEGWFELVLPNQFAGKWREAGAPTWSTWVGTRQLSGWEGIWDTSFGRMRLWQDGDRVHGSYEFAGKSTIEGTIQDGRLEFRYEEPEVKGAGWFDLSPDGQAFMGQWRQQEPVKPEMPVGDWQGRRVHQVPGLTWLVVLEAHWQAHLRENEYAFGHMLREYFARIPGVMVRQRFFTDPKGLKEWCQGLTYLVEPVILVIASHGTEEGIKAHGHVIDGEILAEGLRHADSLRLLHFSSCLMMEKGAGSNWYRSLNAPFPISGYTTVVDWGVSAMTEFLYLDMILGKGLQPEAAAELITRLFPLAGDDPIPDAPYRPARFRFLPGKSALPRVEVGPPK